MNSPLFNPFRYIAGFRSLIIGISIIFATAIIGFFSHTHFPDLISIKTGSYFSLTYYLLQGISNWLVISIVLYLLAIVFSPSKIRAIDIFGTQAFARAPYLIASFVGFSESMEKFGKYILWTTLHTGEKTAITSAELGIAISLIILTLLLTIWLVTLMFNAFKVSANLKGGKSALLFIAAFILSTATTIYITKYLISNFS